MTDIIFATLVLGAVILFGALITIGNERQRKAIDTLRQAAEDWAMQDLRLKRGQMAKDIKIENPLTWLTSAVSKATGQTTSLSLSQTYRDSPIICVACHDDMSGSKLVFATLSPNKVKAIGKQKRSRLSKISDHHPLLPWTKGIETFELTMLNAGVLFDIELPLAWQEFVYEKSPAERLFMYRLPG